MKILVGVDGSEQSIRAVSWCAEYAGALSAEVIAVHAIDLPLYPSAAGFVPLPVYLPPDREKLQEVLDTQWCEPLHRAKVSVRSILAEGYPAGVIREIADKEDVDLVVVGRRGLGGFSELVLGSTGHYLSHHLNRALVIIP